MHVSTSSTRALQGRLPAHSRPQYRGADILKVLLGDLASGSGSHPDASDSRFAPGARANEPGGEFCAHTVLPARLLKVAQVSASEDPAGPGTR